MLLRQLNFGVLSFYQLFYIYDKGKLHFSLICGFYYCLVKEGWALKVGQPFSIRGLVAYKPVAYKKVHFISDASVICQNWYFWVFCDSQNEFL